MKATLDETTDAYIARQADTLAFLMGQEPDGVPGNLEHDLYNLAEDGMMNRDNQLYRAVAEALGLPDTTHAHDIFNQAYQRRMNGAYR